MAFRNTPDDCKWLRETHLRNRNFEFRSFSIIGNVDQPDELAIYTGVRPASSEVPLALFRRGRFGLELQSTTAKPIVTEKPKLELMGPRKPTWLDFAKENGLLHTPQPMDRRDLSEGLM